MSDFRKRTIEFITLAIAADEKGDKTEAFRCYKLGLEWLNTDIKYEKSDRIKTTLRENAATYLTRAEKLKEELYPPVVPQAQGTAARQRSLPHSNGADDEGKDDKQRRDLLKASTLLQPENASQVFWSDIAGLEMAKQLLKEAVVLPMRLPHLFGYDSKEKRKPWSAILLYGPPGTGKTQLARAVATESHCVFFSASASSLVSKWLGESEKAVRDLFQLAREHKPAIIFMDEIESLCGHRGDSNESDATKRVKSEFLNQTNDMDGILLLAATNLPWGIDDAFRRRFKKRIYVPLPDIKAREQLFVIHLNGKNHKLTSRDLQELAQETDGYSGSDIANLIDEAYMLPLRSLLTSNYFVEIDNKWYPCDASVEHARAMTWEDVSDDETLRVDPITKVDLKKAKEVTPPTVSNENLEVYEQWTREFGIKD